MDYLSKDISDRIKSKLKERDPDVLLYIEDEYVDQLINILIDTISEEIVILKKEIKTEYISKNELSDIF